MPESLATLRAVAWLLGCLIFVAAHSARGFTLVTDGKSSCTIVVAENAKPPERLAAEELQSYIAQMTGARLPVSATSGSETTIVVGDHPLGSALTVESRSPEDDAFRIRTDGDKLFLKGATPRGTFYAVYALLERLGCAWFAPATPVIAGHHEFVPHEQTLVLADIDVFERPLMKYRKRDGDIGRRSHSPETWPALFAWMGKLRTNAFSISLNAYEKNREQLRDEAKRRGMILHVGQHDAMGAFLSPKRYFAAHPEWFGMIDGKRASRARGRPVMFETANADALRTFQENLIAYLRSRPEIDVFQLWPPDVALWSESPEARALGEPRERMALLVQQTTKALREAGLTTRIAFLAYSFYTDPPQNMGFEPDTLLEFCPINQDHRYRLNDAIAPANAEYYQQLRAWLKRFPGEIAQYSYYAKYSWRSLPIALPDQIAAEIRHWREIGETGTSLYCEPGNWLTLEVNHLAYGRASWVEKFDAERWYDSYLRARFGAAAEAMRRFHATATQLSLHTLIAQSRTKDIADAQALLAEARAAMKQAATEADTDGAQWLVQKLSWQADYLALALRLREAQLAADKDAQSKVRAEITALVRAHANDGTILDRGYGYSATDEPAD